MKQHTLIENIKPEPHTYLVTIGTDLGQFTGATVCREEDWSHENEIFGFTLAEIKAEIEYAKAKKRFFNAQLKVLQEFWYDLSDTRSYNMDDFWVKKMRIKISDIAWQRDYWTTRIKDLKIEYHDRITTRDIALAKLKDRLN